MADVTADVSSGMFGDYELLGLVGRGGMGDVHRAYDTRRGREVALKVLPPHLAADRTLVERFRREARALVRLTDPYVVPVHDYGEIDGRLFIDMALVDGRDLADILDSGGPMEPARAVHVLGQAARALDTAHRHGLVHRDVKPSNLLVLEDNGDFTYLVDFGIAHAVGAGAIGTSLTATGSTIGTLAYMAPERFVAEQSVDGRADVYALACVLFQMLTGEVPFAFEGVPALLNAHLNVPPPRITDRRPGLSPAWDRVIGRGMAKNVAERYPTAGALAAGTRAALTEQVTGVTSRSSVPPGPPPVPPGVQAPPRPVPGPPGPAPVPERPVARPNAPVPPGPRTPPYQQGPAGPPAAGPGRPRRRGPLFLVAILVAVVAVAVPIVWLGSGTASTTTASATPLPLSESDPSPQPTYHTYRDSARGLSVDVPDFLGESQEIPDGVRFATSNGSVTLDVTVTARTGAAPDALLADTVAGYRAAGAVVTNSYTEPGAFTCYGTDKAGNGFYFSARLGSTSVGTVNWTYPQSERSRWSGFIDRSAASLTVP